MLNLIKVIVMAIFSLLPDSPFPKMIDSVIFNDDFLPFLNWYLPFDICANMMLAWLVCVLVYYCFVMVKKIVYDFVLDKVITAGLSLLGGVGIPK